ncbi:MAG: hypothetical protein ABJC98_07715, partial [Bacteroidota bacterium]
FYESKPEAGIYDASYGVLLKGDGKGNFIVVPPDQTGINIKGAVRDISGLLSGNKQLLIVAKNNTATEIYIEDSKGISAGIKAGGLSKEVKTKNKK